MKTKFFKTGLPIMAFLIAIGLAFATDRHSSTEDNLVLGYIYENGICISKDVDCTTNGIEYCLHDGSEVYRNFISETQCSERMYKWP